MNTMIEKTMQVGRVAMFAAGLAAVLVVGALGASDAEAKKKKPNVVQCVVGQECVGTDGKDRLVGTGESDEMEGKGGNDVYQGNGDGDDPDFPFDASLTSSDTYTGFEPSFDGFGGGTDTVASIADFGGPADVLDLGFLRLFDDVTFVRDNKVSVPGAPSADELRLIGPGNDTIVIVDHFGRGRIDQIEFANGTISAGQAENLAREATPKSKPAKTKTLLKKRRSKE